MLKRTRARIKETEYLYDESKVKGVSIPVSFGSYHNIIHPIMWWGYKISSGSKSPLIMHREYDSIGKYTKVSWTWVSTKTGEALILPKKQIPLKITETHIDPDVLKVYEYRLRKDIEIPLRQDLVDMFFNQEDRIMRVYKVKGLYENLLLKWVEEKYDKDLHNTYPFCYKPKTVINLTINNRPYTFISTNGRLELSEKTIQEAI